MRVFVQVASAIIMVLACVAFAICVLAAFKGNGGEIALAAQLAAASAGIFFLAGIAYLVAEINDMVKRKLTT